jgi:3-carboxy-cis,cis-muconate cycloisomerase
MTPPLSGSFAAPFEDPAVAELFTESAWIRALVRTEAALARAQAAVGVIPADAAAAISDALEAFAPDFAALAAATARDGFPILGLVGQMRARVGGSAAQWIHWGATTQDILDTALVGQVSSALNLLDDGLAAIAATLAATAERHRHTLMIGRTHLQPALPVTFGLAAAAWLAPLLRHRRRLHELRPRLRKVQFGGAAGTLASLGAQGTAVARAFAAELGLAVPPMPWHAQRDTLLEAADWLVLVAGSAAKLAQDILLLTQDEVAEMRESGEESGGGSSAMPQKHNPIACETVLCAARSAAAHRAALAAAHPPEHQRGTTTGQTELLHLPRVCALAGGALRGAARLASGSVVEGARMRRNLDATRGVLMAEAATMALSAHLPVAEARSLVREACAAVRSGEGDLVDALRSRCRAPVDWERLRDPGEYLGSNDGFIDAVLAEARAPL